MSTSRENALVGSKNGCVNVSSDDHARRSVENMEGKKHVVVPPPPPHIIHCVVVVDRADVDRK